MRHALRATAVLAVAIVLSSCSEDPTGPYEYVPADEVEENTPDCLPQPLEFACQERSDYSAYFPPYADLAWWQIRDILRELQQWGWGEGGWDLEPFLPYINGLLEWAAIHDGCRPEFEDCELRYAGSWSPNDHARVAGAIYEIAGHGCWDAALLLIDARDSGRLALWDEHVGGGYGTRYGRVAAEPERAGHILVWSGANDWHPDYNFDSVLAHEAFHVLLPNASEATVDSHAHACTD